MKLISVLSWISILILAVDSSESPESYIVNGAPAKPGEFPFAVALLFKDELYKASGAILNKDWVITVAHLMYKVHTEVRAGAVEAMSKEAQVRAVSKQVVHPEYRHAGLNHDIGLVKVAKSFEFNNYVKALPLNSNFIKGGFKSVVMGFGTTDANDPDANPRMVLYKTSATTITNEVCKKKLTPHVPSTSICTENDPKYSGPCFGDSGAPLVYKNTLIGLAAFGVPCAKGRPDGFTRVSVFVKWVETTLKQN